MVGDRERIVCSRHVQRAVRLITLNSQITRVIRASAPRRLIKLRSIIAVQPSSWSPAGLLGAWLAIQSTLGFSVTHERRPHVTACTREIMAAGMLADRCNVAISIVSGMRFTPSYTRVQHTVFQCQRLSRYAAVCRKSILQTLL